MAGRYQIWDRQSNVYTPVGEELTAQDWMNRYPWIRNPQTVPVVGGSFFNGSYIGELHQMKDMYEKMGADFSECETDEDVLAVIEAHEISMNEPSSLPSVEERTANALEDLVVLTELQMEG